MIESSKYRVLNGALDMWQGIKNERWLGALKNRALIALMSWKCKKKQKQTKNNKDTHHIMGEPVH